MPRGAPRSGSTGRIAASEVGLGRQVWAGNIRAKRIGWGYLQNCRTLDMAWTNMADQRLMLVDWTVKVLNRKAHGIIADIDPAAAVRT
jgi:hypothetical protein